MDELTFHRAFARPGLVLDIGAHDGLLTLPLAALPGSHVHAFEPLPAAFARLERAVAGHDRNITLHQIALGNAADDIALDVPHVRGVAQEQWASVAKDYAAIRRDDPRVDVIDRFTVRQRRIDDLRLGEITAIKLDVEGAEEEVIRGGQETIRRCQPVMTVEIEERHRVGSTRDVPMLLAGLGLCGFFELAGVWHAVETFAAEALQRASPSPANFTASDPYVFIFYFVPNSLRETLLALRP